MKILKPGQLVTINNVVYRAHKRIDGCKGCSLNSFDMCPNIVDYRMEPILTCNVSNIIFKKV